MSADSPRRTSRKGSTGHVILPRPVSDPSIIDSLAGFIHDVVPQAYSSVLPGDNRESVVWARFEQADYNNPALYPDSGDDCDATPPLLLILGYVNGVQVWSLPASGEAIEVLSWNQRVVKTLRFLPAPDALRLSLQPDPYAHKRPLVAIVDNTGPGPQFCSVNFISLHSGDQVKTIKFKNPVNDVLANRKSIVTTFPEKIAVFDAFTLEDRMTVTTCYQSPAINPNPVSLGSRWLAYADKRLVSWWRSQGGGCEGDGTQSYTATVLHAAKSLGKGLRDLSGSVASSLTGAPLTTNMLNGGQMSTPGVVTILDIEGNGSSLGDHVIAHFVAHCEPIVALSFDPSGLLLLTVDKCGYRFHLFRIQPHPSGPSLSEVHHLYTLHRGDTSARIQDIAFSSDSRWVAVSSLRGTTHVFPITPYGGPIGVRTHTTPHVVNRLSRFHRSAGLRDEGGRNSPVAHDGPPLTPPLPARTIASCHAITVQPHAQLRHQAATPSSSEDAMVRLAASFSPPRSSLPGLPNSAVTTSKNTRRALDSLYVMACHGRLVQYDLEPRHLSGVAKDRICDDTAIELCIDPKAEWILLRPPLFNPLQPPLSPSNPLLTLRPEASRFSNCVTEKSSQNDEHWLSQVEIMTHAGPHRRLWMGPQFTFKTYSLASSDIERESVEVGSLPLRSNPVNMPLHPHLLIESGSSSSLEQSPHLMEVFENSLGPGESRLREDLADAMLESPGSASRTAGNNRSVWVVGGTQSAAAAAVVQRRVNPLGTVITIDPEVIAADSTLGSAPAALAVADLIIVPAQSASASTVTSEISSKVNRKHKSDIQVPETKVVANNTCIDNLKCSIKDDSVQVVFDSTIKTDCVSSVSKSALEKPISSSKDKRKTGKKEKRNCDLMAQVNVKSEVALTEEKHFDKSVSSVKPSFESSRKQPKVAEKEKGESNKKLSKTYKQCDGSDISEERLQPSTDDKYVVSSSLKEEEKLPIAVQCSDHELSRSLNDEHEGSTPICDVWSKKSFSDCLKKVCSDSCNGETVDAENTSCNNMTSQELPVEKTEQTSCNASEVLCGAGTNSVINSATSSKAKRKSKTLGRKMKFEMPEKSVVLPSKADDINSLSNKVDSVINCGPNVENIANADNADELLSEGDDNCNCQTSGVEFKLVDECVEQELVNPTETNTTEEGLMEDLKKSKLRNDETTDKDSSDDTQNASLRSDLKYGDNTVKQKKKKSHRKQKEIDFVSGNDAKSCREDLYVNEEEQDVVFEESPETFENSVSVEEKRPKLSWSSVVSMGKQDANGNFSKSESNWTMQSQEADATSPLGANGIEEKEVSVKTNSTEDRSSVYESCSESVGEGNQFEMAQQQLSAQEMQLSASETAAVNVASSSQNIDDDSVDKSNTDSGDGNQSASKKSRKQRRKRR